MTPPATRRRSSCPAGVLVAFGVVVAVGTAGCVDVRSFAGLWTGSIVAEGKVRKGFEDDVRVDALWLADVTLQGLSARLSTSDGRFVDAPLSRVSKAAADALASLTFDGDPLRSYLLFSRPANEDEAALMVLSLYGDNHVELRILRNDDLFGIFYLREDPTARR